MLLASSYSLSRIFINDRDAFASLCSTGYFNVRINFVSAYFFLLLSINRKASYAFDIIITN